jgi:glutamine amidotransferase
MEIAIVKYNAGNVESVRNALRRFGIEPIVTDEPSNLQSADRVIFPGVGEALSAMASLREKGLDSVLRSLTQPVLGICLGMQLLCRSSEENETECLGLIPYRVRRFDTPGLKIPHMGWNRITVSGDSLFNGIDDHAYVYFVHGYFVEDGEFTTARCDYGGTFSAAVRFRNFFATQFHPEKSGEAGERILENFLRA